LSIRKKTLLYIITIIFAGIIIYANGLQGPFIFDDELLVKENEYIRDLSLFPKYFTTGVFAGAARQSVYYRPLQTLSYAIDHLFWKQNPLGYHISSVIIHLCMALSIFWFVKLIYDNRLMAWIAAIFFVVHPIHTEAVTYISGRSDPLAAVFLILAFIFYKKESAKKSIVFLTLCVLAYTCSLLSREASIIFPLLVLAYHYSLKEKIPVRGFSAILFVSATYFVVRTCILSHLLAAPAPPAISLAGRLPGVFVAIFNYTRLVLIPLNLHMEYGQVLFSFTDYKVILGLLICVLTAALFLKKRNDPLISFSLLWLVVTLLPVMNLFPVGTFMAEHWLYLPSVGLFLLLARSITSLYQKERLRVYALAIAAGLLVFYAIITVKQNSYWGDKVFFFERTLRFSPKSARAWLELGNAYSERGNFQKARDSLEKAIEVRPDYAAAYYNTGRLYTEMGKTGEAITAYKKSIEIKPNVPSYNNLGNIYLKTGEVEKAVRAYQDSLRLFPNYASYNNLGNLYAALGKREEAIKFYKEALKISPRDASIHNNLAVAYYRRKEYRLAIEHCDTALRLGVKVNPDFLNALEPYRKRS